MIATKDTTHCPLCQQLVPTNSEGKMGFHKQQGVACAGVDKLPTDVQAPFVRNPNADTGGTSLQAYLDQVSAPDMQRAFGKCDPDGYVDAEAGYDGLEWTFEASDGRVFKVYSRFDAFRVGAHQGVETADFIAWLGEALKGGAK